MRRGAWELREQIGQGGLGIVWLAQNDAGRQVALKTVRADALRAVPALTREIGVLAGLSHPGVVQIVDHGVHDGQPWYAMELLSAVPLDAFLETVESGANSTWVEGDPDVVERLVHQDLPPSTGSFDRALRLVRRVCDPLAWLHGEGIVHRDLKPANVLVRADGSPVLVDFGIAAAFAGRGGRDRLDGGHVRAGTPLYMAPEQIRGDRVDARADLYALGCMLYQVVTGRPPFFGGQQQVIEQHLSSAPRPLSDRNADVPAALEELVMALLAKAPEHRPGYAGEVAAILDGLVHRPEPRLGPPPRAHVYRPRLVGRTAELADIVGTLDALEAGAGSGLILSGPSGRGKTRLALEAGRLASRRRLRVHATTCSPGAPRALSLFAPLFAELDAQRHRSALWERRWSEIGPVLAGAWPALDPDGVLPPPPELDQRTSALRLYDALQVLLTSLAAERPFLFLVDDLQWADPLSLAALTHVLHPGAVPPVAVVATARPSEALGALRLLPDVRFLEVEPLDVPQVHQIVDDMLATATEGLVADLAGRASGSPMAATELVRTAVGDGWLHRQDGAWRITKAPERGRFYRDLPALVAHRLGTLDESARRCVEAASVLGSRCTLAHLEALIGPVPPRVLRDLRRREVLDVDPEGSVGFVHDALREGAYDALWDERRAALHSAAADSGFDHDPQARARHLEAAGRVEEAVVAWREAAALARTACAWQAMADALRRAVDLAPPGPDRARDRDRLAASQLSMADPAVLLAVVEPGLAEVGDDRVLHADLLQRIARIHMAARNAPAAVAAFEEALDLLGPGADALDRVRIVGQLAQVLANGGDLPAARARMAEAEHIGASDPGDRCRYLLATTRAVLENAAGHVQAAILAVETALALPLAHGPHERPQVLWQLGFYRLLAGDRAGAEAAMAETHELAWQVGDLGLAAGVSLMRGVMGSQVHRREHALQHYAAALELYGRIHNDVETVNAGLNVALVTAELGDLSGGRAALGDARAVLDRIDYPRGEGMWLVFGATIERRAGSDPAVQRARATKALRDEGLALQDRPMAACEAGHCALALGEDAGQWVAEARRLTGGHIGFADSAITRLEAAQAAFEGGEHLIHGERRQDVPPGLLQN